MTGWGVTNLSVRFGRREALSGVTLDVPAGAVTAVIGGDGAGKTTLLRALAGVVRPAGGTVRRPPRARVGYVGGSSGLYGDLTVAENVAFVGAAYGVRGAELAARRADLLARTGLEGTEDRLAGRLSGGMRQKLAFALALLHAPGLLILDEPTTGVDPVSRADLWRLIAGAAADGAAVVVSTTYRDEAQRAAMVLALEAGRTLALGPADEVVAKLYAAGVAADLAGPAPAAAPPAGGPGAERAAGARTQAPPLLAARRATRLFGSLAAVEDVDLQVSAGEVVGLLGANGAGKTTLIRLCLGLLRPSSGTLRLFGRPPSRESRLRLGYVPQSRGLWDDLTVQQNLEFSARAFGTAVPALESELADARGTVVRELPLGLQRRLAVAAALAHGPELLVLDEPSSGVDPIARDRLWGTIHASAATGAGVLATTHYLEEAAYCDRLVIMAAGRVVAAGTLAEIVGDAQAVEVTAPDWASAFGALEDAGAPAALVGTALRVPGEDAARVQRLLDVRGVSATLRLVPATLEETFVRLTLDAGDAGPHRSGERPDGDDHRSTPEGIAS